MKLCHTSEYYFEDKQRIAFNKLHKRSAPDFQKNKWIVNFRTINNPNTLNFYRI